MAAFSLWLSLPQTQMVTSKKMVVVTYNFFLYIESSNIEHGTTALFKMDTICATVAQKTQRL